LSPAVSKVIRANVAAFAISCIASGVAHAEAYKCRLRPNQTFDTWTVADGKITVASRSDLAQSPPWVFPIVKDNADELVGMQDLNEARFTFMLLIDKHTAKVALLNVSPNSAVMDRVEGDCEKIE
jgi:hypothetical protein